MYHRAIYCVNGLDAPGRKFDSLEHRGYALLDEKNIKSIFWKRGKRTFDEAFDRISFGACSQTSDIGTSTGENAVNSTLVPTIRTDSALFVGLGARVSASLCGYHHHQRQQASASNWVHSSVMRDSNEASVSDMTADESELSWEARRVAFNSKFLKLPDSHYEFILTQTFDNAPALFLPSLIGP